MISADKMYELRGLINEWSVPSGFEGTPAADVLLAVSGGIDSMCMADMFASCGGGLTFAMAHCNFHLRGEESDGDEMMVRNWAREHGIVIHVRDFDTESYARENNVSIEMAARELRYSWFAGLCRQYGYKAVCVAHNANDNAETLMLNLLRGSGISGLSGMSLVSSVPCQDAEDIRLVRPLLGYTRNQIEGYVFYHKVPYREDSTNAMSDYKRNRIRNEVFPVFEAMNPSFVRTLNREMGYFSAAGDIVEDWCRALLPSVVTHSPSAVRISLPALLNVRHWRYLLYYILEPYGFNASVLASVEDLLTSSRTVSGKRFEAAEYTMITGRDELVVTSSAGVRPDDAEVIEVPSDGVYTFNGHTVEVKTLQWSSDMPLKQNDGVLIMNASRLGFPFVLRRWQAGDWLVPLGMRGKKKVSDLFTDLKYDALRKEAAIMIAESVEERHVAAVAGVRIDERYRVTPSSTSVVSVSII